jgi:hypothetical protein
VTNATNTLAIGGFPLIQPGRFFLAVRDTTASTNNAFALRADIECNTNAPVAPFISPGDSKFVAGGFKLQWAAAPTATFMVLYADALPGPWNTVPLQINSPNGTFTFTDDGTLTGGVIATNRFYRILQLSP